MTLYADTSALLKRYIDEPDSDSAEAHLLADPVWVTGHHSLVEVRRNLARLLGGRALGEAQELFRADWARVNVVSLDVVTLQMAADIAELTGARTLDALHLACATRLGVDSISFLTYDIRQAQAARTLQLKVIGV